MPNEPAQTPTPTSPEYDRFAALLGRVLATPKSVIDQREKEEAVTKAWRAGHGMKQQRQPKRGIADTSS
jgi:hypothetical protein